MASIKAIEGRSIHQIQSGQVIVDLISVVKELVENSLDAGATSIEVRFKNHGLDSIEVQDNGKGIAPEDFETLALKHHTSKLSSYEDLASLDTFGFRGEALSSLCALSRFHVVTARAQDGALGKNLEFETSGKLKGMSPVAAQKGTTVSVENLFATLPVRRKELEKNVKREYNKVLSHLYAYACISVGVRFSVSNQMPKAKRVPVFSTKSNATTKENITNVFGAKTLLALVNLDLHLEMEPNKGPSTQSVRNWTTQDTDRSRQVHVHGHISKPIFGEGRQTPDRQMFFVNSRPCALPQVTKAFNEVYKSFNVSQSPFIFANLVMDTNSYDVNVSPDKRSIMLHDQAALLESLKSALTELFEQTDHTVPQSQLPNRKLPNYRPLTVLQKITLEESAQPQEDESEADSEDDEVDEDESQGIDKVRRREDGQMKGTPPSLIHDWIGRDTEIRKNKPSSKKPQESKPKEKDTVQQFMQKHNNASNSRHDGLATRANSTLVPVHSHVGEERDSGSTNDEGQSPGVVDEEILPTKDADQNIDPSGSPYDDLFSQRPQALPRPVRDFNTLVDRNHGRNEALDEPNGSPPKSREHMQQPESEVAISAITPVTQKAAPGPIQSAFDRMRPKRTPLQTAEITVGDTTTTTVLGSSPPYKKRRIHRPLDSQSIAQFGGSPLVVRGLRNFAAPGSQMAFDRRDLTTQDDIQAQSSDEAADESSEDEREDSPDADDESSAGQTRLPVISDATPSDGLDALLPVSADDDEFDSDYIDETEKKIREDKKVARLIQEAELSAARPTEQNLKRASQLLKSNSKRKDSTLQLVQYVHTSADRIAKQSAMSKSSSAKPRDQDESLARNAIVKDEIDDSNAEQRLSLTVNKSDFDRMTVIGQFNLGFILAVRPASGDQDEDELFIIDQHAADEKYNYERLQRTVTLQSQRLVRPKALELTAVEEEIVLNNKDALKANGFEIETTSYVTDEEESADRRCRLITLPMSKEKTFEISDLEELLHLLSEAPAGGSPIPRPRKVQSMLAMRACRSSIMVGKTLTLKNMQKAVRHMGEMEKPWNCPHGRPTMRHLAGLGAWTAWEEGDVVDDSDDIHDRQGTDWKAFLERHR